MFVIMLPPQKTYEKPLYFWQWDANGNAEVTSELTKAFKGKKAEVEEQLNKLKVHQLEKRYNWKIKAI